MYYPPSQNEAPSVTARETLLLEFFDNDQINQPLIRVELDAQATSQQLTALRNLHMQDSGECDCACE